MDRRLAPALAWVVCAVVAIAIGIAAVTTVGASVRGRGPLGDGEIEQNVREVRPGQPSDELSLSPLPGAETVSDTIAAEFGELDVECRGAVAYATAARPAAGWEVVSYEEGPDDDVDAVFARTGRSIEFEVYCNRGVPTLGDYEENTLPGSEGDD